jgi:hypothetical protein
VQLTTHNRLQYADVFAYTGGDALFSILLTNSKTCLRLRIANKVFKSEVFKLCRGESSKSFEWSKRAYE